MGKGSHPPNLVNGPEDALPPPVRDTEEGAITRREAYPETFLLFGDVGLVCAYRRESRCLPKKFTPCVVGVAHGGDPSDHI